MSGLMRTLSTLEHLVRPERRRLVRLVFFVSLILLGMAMWVLSGRLEHYGR